MSFFVFVVLGQWGLFCGPPPFACPNFTLRRFFLWIVFLSAVFCVPVPRPKFPLSGPKFPLNGPKFPLNGPKLPLNGPKFPLNGPNFRLTGPNFRLTGPNFRLASGGHVFHRKFRTSRKRCDKTVSTKIFQKFTQKTTQTHAAKKMRELCQEISPKTRKEGGTRNAPKQWF